MNPQADAPSRRMPPSPTRATVQDLWVDLVANIIAEEVSREQEQNNVMNRRSKS